MQGEAPEKFIYVPTVNTLSTLGKVNGRVPRPFETQSMMFYPRQKEKAKIQMLEIPFDATILAISLLLINSTFDKRNCRSQFSLCR